jgi:hypothetical protein
MLSPAGVPNSKLSDGKIWTGSGSEIQLERGIVQQHVDECKTEGSRRGKFLDPKLLGVLTSWKQSTEFRESDDWIFASPVKLGRLPISYTCYKETLQAAREPDMCNKCVGYGPSQHHVNKFILSPSSRFSILNLHVYRPSANCGNVVHEVR